MDDRPDTETPVPETFEETCARLGFEIDTESTGSTIIFGSSELMAALKKQAHVKEESEQ